MLVSDVLNQAAQKLNIIEIGGSLSTAQQSDALVVLNAILDEAANDNLLTYVTTSATFATVAGTQTYTLGPTGSWALPSPNDTLRPIRLRSGKVQISATGGYPVYQPLNLLLSERQYTNLAVPTLPSVFPTDVWDAGGWPNRTLTLWPNPNGVLNVVLTLDVPLKAYAASDTFTLPPGYQRWLTYAVACDLADSYGQAAAKGPLLAERDAARDAIATSNAPNDIMDLCADTPFLNREGAFNYLSGDIV